LLNVNDDIKLINGNSDTSMLSFFDRKGDNDILDNDNSFKEAIKNRNNEVNLNFSNNSNNNNLISKCYKDVAECCGNFPTCRNLFVNQDNSIIRNVEYSLIKDNDKNTLYFIVNNNNDIYSFPFIYKDGKYENRMKNGSKEFNSLSLTNINTIINGYGKTTKTVGNDKTIHYLESEGISIIPDCEIIIAEGNRRTGIVGDYEPEDYLFKNQGTNQIIDNRLNGYIFTDSLSTSNNYNLLYSYHDNFFIHIEKEVKRFPEKRDDSDKSRDRNRFINMKKEIDDIKKFIDKIENVEKYSKEKNFNTLLNDFYKNSNSKKVGDVISYDIYKEFYISKYGKDLESELEEVKNKKLMEIYTNLDENEKKNFQSFDDFEKKYTKIKDLRKVSNVSNNKQDEIIKNRYNEIKSKTIENFKKNYNDEYNDLLEINDSGIIKLALKNELDNIEYDGIDDINTEDMKNKLNDEQKIAIMKKIIIDKNYNDKDDKYKKFKQEFSKDYRNKNKKNPSENIIKDAYKESIYKDYIDNYQLTSEQKETIKDNKVREVFEKYKNGLKEYSTFKENNYPNEKNINISSKTIETLKMFKDMNLNSNILPFTSNINDISDIKLLYRDATSIDEIWNKIVETYNNNQNYFNKEQSELFIKNFNSIINDYILVFTDSDYASEYSSNEEISGLKLNNMMSLYFDAIEIYENKYDESIEDIELYPINEFDSQSQLNKEKFKEVINKISKIVDVDSDNIIRSDNPKLALRDLCEKINNLDEIEIDDNLFNELSDLRLIHESELYKNDEIVQIYYIMQ